MANQLKMATVQSILSLHQKGWTQQKIAQALGIDRGTVSGRRIGAMQRQTIPLYSRDGGFKTRNCADRVRRPGQPTGSVPCADRFAGLRKTNRRAQLAGRVIGGKRREASRPTKRL